MCRLALWDLLPLSALKFHSDPLLLLAHLFRMGLRDLEPLLGHSFLTVLLLLLALMCHLDRRFLLDRLFRWVPRGLQLLWDHLCRMVRLLRLVRRFLMGRPALLHR